MGELEPTSDIASRHFPVDTSPLLRRLKNDGYEEDDLTADVKRWGREVSEAYSAIYAAACQYAERYGGESNDERREATKKSNELLRFKTTFDTLELRCDDPTVLGIASYLRAVARADEAAVGLLISGVPGTFKTWLCKATRAEAVRYGNTAIVYPIRRLVYDVQKTYSSGGGTEEQVIRQILNHRIICLDDLGREKGTRDAARVVSNAIDAIEREADQHTLIVTTNATAKDLAETYEPATLSRIRGMCDQVTIDLADTRGRGRKPVLGGSHG